MRRWFGWSNEITVPETGYFFCPECVCRRATGVYQVRRRLYVAGLAVHTVTLPAAFYRCEACGREYAAEEGHGYDFSDRPEGSTWSCFRCGGTAPGHVFTCPHCGFSLNRTLESLTPMEPR